MPGISPTDFEPAPVISPPTKKYTGTYLYDTGLASTPAGTFIGEGGIRVQAETYQQAQMKLVQQARDKAAKEQYEREIAAQQAAEARAQAQDYASASTAAIARAEQGGPVYGPQPAADSYGPRRAPTRAEIIESLGMPREVSIQTIAHPGSTSGLQPSNLALIPPKQEIRAATGAEAIPMRIGAYNSFAGEVSGQLIETGKTIAEQPIVTAAVIGGAAILSKNPIGAGIVYGATAASVIQHTMKEGPAAAVSDVLFLGAASKAGELVAGIGKSGTSPKIKLETSSEEGRLKDIAVPEGLSMGVGESTYRAGDILVRTQLQETTRFIETPAGTASRSQAIGEQTMIDAPQRRIINIGEIGGPGGKPLVRILGPSTQPTLISIEPVSAETMALTTPSKTIPKMSEFVAQVKSKTGDIVTTEEYAGRIKEVASYKTDKGAYTVSDMIAVRTKPEIAEELSLTMGGGVSKIPAKLGAPYRPAYEAARKPDDVPFMPRLKKQEPLFLFGKLKPPKAPIMPRKPDTSLRIYDNLPKRAPEKAETTYNMPEISSPRQSSQAAQQLAFNEPLPREKTAALYDKPVPSFAQFTAQKLGFEKASALSMKTEMKTEGLSTFPLASGQPALGEQQKQYSGIFQGGIQKERSVLKISQESRVKQEAATQVKTQTITGNIVGLGSITKIGQKPAIITGQITPQVEITQQEQKIFTIQGQKEKQIQKITQITDTITEPTPARQPPKLVFLPRLPRFSGSIGSASLKKSGFSLSLGKQRKGKTGINPLADWLSVTQTEAKTFGVKALHQAPTQKVKQAFSRQLAANPLGFRFQTAKEQKRVKRTHDLTIDIPSALNGKMSKLLEWKPKQGRRFI